MHEDRNVKPIPTIALEADRFDVSNRAAAAISTAALTDFGIVSAENRTHIIDFNKVWKARQKLRKNVRKDEVFLQNDVSAIVIAPSFFILIICRCWASNTFIFPIFCSNQKKAFACSFCALYFALFFAVLENHFFTFLHGC